MARKKKLETPSPEPNQSESKVILELIQYDEKNYTKYDQTAISEMIGLIKSDQVNWINLDGLQDKSIVQKLADHFRLDSLIVEDITSEHQPKAEEYDNFLFFTLKTLYRIEERHIEYEQISFVLGQNYLLSFQEKDGDLFGNLRDRIRLDQGRIRKRKVDYLLYRLVDTIVDNYYNVLDTIGQQIEEIEEGIYSQSSETYFREIQQLKKELIFLRKALYPLRDALSKIVKDETGFIEVGTLRYFADVYDHVVHLIDSLDTYKDLSSGLMDIYINTLNTRMNEVMKVLTIISTIFMPLTFIVGVYGMNFNTETSPWNMPELNAAYGYPIVMGIMLLIVILMIRYFKFKKWY